MTKAGFCSGTSFFLTKMMRCLNLFLSLRLEDHFEVLGI